jgi:hypothetical protein
MGFMAKWPLLTVGFLLAAVRPLPSAVVNFSSYDWAVRSGRGGPGPNLWDEKNVWLDASGALHLKIAHQDGKWSCAEVTMRRRLGFGRYEFQIKGPVGKLDDNVVLGLFNYPTREVGPDATHEIDIEFSRWGKADNALGNYTVWPAEKGLKQQTRSFSFTLQTVQSTHRFTWSRTQILFQSLRGLRNDDADEFGRWIFNPPEPARSISGQPMPVHINLWLFKGLEPKDGQEVEVVVQRFSFLPE